MYRSLFIVLALFGVLLSGLMLLVSCYDANSPHLPPCPEGGVGYTDPAGCFEHRLHDGGYDAR